MQSYIKKKKIPHFSFDTFLTLSISLFKYLENNDLNNCYIKTAQREFGFDIFLTFAIFFVVLKIAWQKYAKDVDFANKRITYFTQSKESMKLDDFYIQIDFCYSFYSTL